MKSCLRFIILLFIAGSCKTPVQYSNSISSFYIPGNDSSTIADSATLAVIRPYQNHLGLSMNEVLAKSQQPLEKGQPESRLGNFVADLCMEMSKKIYTTTDSIPPDFCILNNGGLRSSLPQGDILLKNVYELMPFENELVIVTINHHAMEKLFDYIIEKGGVPVSNIRMKIGSGVAEDVMINGKPYDKNLNYKVLTSDFLASGGDNMIMFENPVKIEQTGLKVRDAIINYMKLSNQNQSYIIAETDGRISK